jgi:hypothetical protein
MAPSCFLYWSANDASGIAACMVASMVKPGSCGEHCAKFEMECIDECTKSGASKSCMVKKGPAAMGGDLFKFNPEGASRPRTAIGRATLVRARRMRSATRYVLLGVLRLQQGCC